MLRLALRNLRSRPARTTLTALAIALGVAMIFATRIVTAAVQDATGQARSSRLVGADLEVRTATSAFLSDELVREIAGRPEVELATATYLRPEGAFDPSAEHVALSGSYAFSGTGLLLLGVEPESMLTPYELAAGALFSSPDADEVLLPQAWAEQAGLDLGDQIPLTTMAQIRLYTVVGLLRSSQQNLLIGQPTVWLPLATMQSAFDTPGAATSILIRLKEGILLNPASDHLQESLGPLYVVGSATGDAEGSIKSPMVMIINAALPLTGISVLVAGSFFVYNAFAITLTERRREIGQLRTLGMTRRQILRQITTEALLTALLGSILGLILGTVIGRGMMEVFVGFIQGQAIPEPSWPISGALLASATGVAVTLLVTLNLAVQAGRISPLEVLRSSLGQKHGENWYTRWGWIASLACLALFLAASAFVDKTMQQATSLDLLAVWFVTPFMLAGAALLSLPVGVRSALWLIRRISARLGVAPRLASGNLTRQQARSILTSATLMMGLMLVVGLAGMTEVEKHFFRGNLLPLFDADFMLVPPSSFGSYENRVSLPSLPPPPPGLQAELDALALEAEVYYVANIQLPGYGSGPMLDNGWALSLGLVRDSAIYSPAEGSWEQAEQIFSQGLAMTIPEIAARRLNLHPGDTVEVYTFEGTLPFKIALVGGPLPLVTTEVGKEFFHSYPLLTLISARPGTDKAALEAQLRDLAERYTLAFTADLRKDFGGTVDQIFETALALFAGLTSITGLVAGLSIANTLIAAVIERRREIGVLRALGMTRRQVRWLITVEAGLLGLVGAIIGVLAGMAMALAFAHTIDSFSEVVGFRAPQRMPVPWVVAAAAILAGPTMAMLAGLFPAARAARTEPGEAMRAE